MPGRPASSRADATGTRRGFLARRALRLGGGLVAAVAFLGVLDRAFPPDLSRYRANSLEVLDRDGNLLDLTTAPDRFVRLRGDPGQVSAMYLDFLLKREDRRFWHHPGVDPLALARASWQVLSYGHVVSGGSTLTMQVARLLVPHRHSLGGKFYDIARALQLEAHYSKREILQMYLTLAPYGGNVEGVRAASLLYFGHEPDRLTPLQAALLVALPQSPARLRPDLFPAQAQAAATRILAEVAKESVGHGGSMMIAPHTAHSLLVPHLKDRLIATGRTDVVRTTIDRALQEQVVALTGRSVQGLGAEATISALIVDNRHHEIRAYLGGTDYFGRQGMVDMTTARRSPGSTLKPFIYGLAFDDNLIRPETLIDDSAADFGGYAPHDFDYALHGRVTVREALQQSYNLPAIKILQEVGPGRFVSALENATAVIKLPQGAAPSLPIALGGLGISLQDLAMLYSGLANGGKVAPLRFTADGIGGQSIALMSVSAAWQIGDILRGTPRPEGVMRQSNRPIAFKTGTSYGFRDAWAIGYSPQYTVAVWVGRIDGTPRPGAYGLNTAAPLLFRLFDLLPPEDEAAPSAPPSQPLHPDQARLSPSLRYFDAIDLNGLMGAPTLHILFPPQGVTLDVTSQDAAGGGDHYDPVALEATGGAPPYRWAVNGMPLASPSPGVETSWLPDGPGFFHLSVTDHRDVTVSEDVRLQ